MKQIYIQLNILEQIINIKLFVLGLTATDDETHAADRKCVNVDGKSFIPVAESSYSMLDYTIHHHGDIPDQSQATADLRAAIKYNDISSVQMRGRSVKQALQPDADYNTTNERETHKQHNDCTSSFSILSIRAITLQRVVRELPSSMSLPKLSLVKNTISSTIIFCQTLRVKSTL